MKDRLLRLLSLLAAISIVSASYAIWQSNASHKALTVDRTLFPDLAAQTGDIARIEIVGDGQTISLLRDGKSWVLPQKDRYPADAAHVNQFISSVAHMALVEKKTANPLRYADLKLAPPGKDAGDGSEIKLFDAHDVVLADAVIGKAASNLGRVGGGFYARRVDEAPSWLVEGTIDVPLNVLDWAPHELFVLYDPKTIKTAKLVADGKTIVTVKRAKPTDETFSIMPAPPGKIDYGKALRLITLPIALSFDDVRPAPSSEQKPTRIATFSSYASDQDYRLFVYGDGMNIWVKAQETGTGEAVKRFNAFHDKWLYKLPSYRSELLNASLGDFSIKETGK